MAREVVRHRDVRQINARPSTWADTSHEPCSTGQKSGGRVLFNESCQPWDIWDLQIDN